MSESHLIPQLADPENQTKKWKFPVALKKGPIKASDRAKAFAVEPIDVLPKFLLPAMTRHLKRRPPTFHLGWLIDDAVLVRLANEGGFGRQGINLREFLGDEYVEPDDDDEDEDDDDEPNHINKIQGFMKRCDELQLQVFPGLARVYDSSTKTVAHAVSIMSNFQIGTGRGSPEDCEKLVREFKFEGEPKWYLDYEKWHWRQMK